jgi:hypothetical protein
MATNVNSENARSRMEASSMGKCEYGGKGRRVRYWVHLGCWISLYYSPFLLGVRFETYELSISFKFKIFSGCGKPWTTVTMDTESVDTGAHLYTECGNISMYVFKHYKHNIFLHMH